ncbi:MAG: pyridoxal-phosphate-dependent aminotransferase family protein [Desulfonatronovibrionaceae bacterium]
MDNKKRLLTPGPTPIPEEVRLAMARDMIHHRKDEFVEVMHRVHKGLRYLFCTEGAVLPLSCSGTGAMTAAVNNLFSPGEKVITVEAGKFGQRWSDIAQARGLEVIALPLDWGTAVSAADVENALSRWPDVSGLLVQASETSTGVLHPVRELAALCRQQGILSVVDGISAVGISPCPMDEWGIDCLLTGSQKGLMLPPGMAFIALSDRAWDKTEQARPKDFYFHLSRERDKSACGQTLFTSPVSLVLGLDRVLEMFREQGLDRVYARQRALTEMVRAGVRAIGLDLFVPASYTLGLTSISLPPGIDGSRLVDTAAREHGVYMAGGQDQLKGRIVRIGHMGYVDWADLLAGLQALCSSLKSCYGFTGSRDYLERAMAAYYQNLGGQDE